MDPIKVDAHIHEMTGEWEAGILSKVWIRIITNPNSFAMGDLRFLVPIDQAHQFDIGQKISITIA